MSANLYTADLDSLGRTEIYAAIEALLRLKLTTDLKHDQFRSVLAHIRQCAPCFDELREIRRKAKANIHKVGHGGKDAVVQSLSTAFQAMTLRCKYLRIDPLKPKSWFSGRCAVTPSKLKQASAVLGMPTKELQNLVQFGVVKPRRRRGSIFLYLVPVPSPSCWSSQAHSRNPRQQASGVCRCICRIFEKGRGSDSRRASVPIILQVLKQTCGSAAFFQATA